MECMDFIILKVNGTDVSSSSHADAVREFMAADEPIIVELVRRVSSLNSNQRDVPTSSEQSSCSSTTSSISNKNLNQFESSTSFNIVGPDITPIYTNQSIIKTSRSEPEPEKPEAEQTTSTSEQVTVQLVNVDVDDGRLASLNRLDRTNKSDSNLDKGNGVVIADCAESDSDSDSASASTSAGASASDSDSEELLLYQNGCIVNKCIGCNCCQISVNNESEDERNTYKNVAKQNILASTSTSVAVAVEQPESVSVSTQTHLTALNWMDDIEDCLCHIKLGVNSVPQTKPQMDRSQDNIMDDAIETIDADASAGASVEGSRLAENNCGSEKYLLEREHINNDNDDSHNILIKEPTNSFIRTQVQSINKEISELDNRMHNIHIISSSKAIKANQKLRTRPRSRNRKKNRTRTKTRTRSKSKSKIESENYEHIYETIQESEANEPIYSLPYEYEYEYDPDSDIIVQRTLTSVSVDKKKRSKHKNISTNTNTYTNYNNINNNGLLQLPTPSVPVRATPTTTLYENSPSAYNTCAKCYNIDGACSNSNQHSSIATAKSTSLTCKLGCNYKNRSILQLCSSGHYNQHYRYSTSTSNSTSTQRLIQSNSTNNHGIIPMIPMPLTTNCIATNPPKFKAKTSSAKRSLMHGSKSLPNANANVQISADTMYTNMENLHQTILLQQQLFRRALSQQTKESVSVPVPVSERSNTNTASCTFPGGSTKTTINLNNLHQPEPHASVSTSTSNDQELKMEWKVKRRPNGTRYITRRPIRNRILRNRTKEIIEERTGGDLTTSPGTEDDTCSEIKIGRYWTKDERRRQILDREHKNNKIDGCKKCFKCVPVPVPVPESVPVPVSVSVPTSIMLSANNIQKSSTSPNELQLQPMLAVTDTDGTGTGTGTTSTGTNDFLPTCTTYCTSSPSTVTQQLQHTIKNKKSLKSKKSHKDKDKDTTTTKMALQMENDYDFKTVQDMIVNGATNTHSNSKMIGLLSVTTV